jgi:hypothetical protein
MFLKDPFLITHRHLPPGELHHLAAMLFVPGIERGPL